MRLDLSRTALGVRMRELLAQTARIASDAGPLTPEEAVGQGSTTHAFSAVRRSSR